MHPAMRNRKKQLLATLEGTRISDSSEFVREVAVRLYESLDTPKSLACYILLKNNEWEQLLGMAIDPFHYLDRDASRFADDYQAISFLKKYPGFDTGVDPEAAAWEKFQAAERQCRDANSRLRQCRSSGVYPSGMAGILHRSAEKIYHWLGRLTASAWAEKCRFGPGSDDLTKGRRISVYNKLHSGFSVTADFQDGARGLVQSHPRWAKSFLGEEWVVGSPASILGRVAPGNKVAFVPKTALTHRSIAVEPQLNIYAQLGLGGMLRDRLRINAGLDLDDQEPNRLAAFKGSVDGNLSTIDLSSASDTLATELVRELLPPTWHMALDWVRSKTGQYQGKTFWYEKFSSMGNGFTFELESMIFYALALSVCDEVIPQRSKEVRAFGDDIIVPTQAFNRLVEVLEFCGFSTNIRKSYSTGVFRESCGHDYFNGTLVRPFFLKEEIDSVEGLYRLANGLRCTAGRRNRIYGCDNRFRRPWLYAVSRIPRIARELIEPARAVSRYDGGVSLECGDGGLLLSWEEATASPWFFRSKDGHQGWTFMHYTAITRKRKIPGAASESQVWAYLLYVSRDGSSSTPVGDYVPFRGSEERRLSVTSVPDFIEIGPWV